MTYDEFISTWESLDIVHLDANCFESEGKVYN
jgi:hypothetical protein